MKIAENTLVNGTVNSKLVNGIDQYPNAVAVCGYIPKGYDNSHRRTTKERQDLGCRQVVVQKSLSGESWRCIDVVDGTIRLFPVDVDPQWAAEMAAAEFAGEFSA